MPQNYILKKNPISRERLIKLAKSLIDEADEDRKRATESYDYFKEKVDTFHTDPLMEKVVCAAEKCMVDCLSAINDSKFKIIKALEIIHKITSTANKDGEVEDKTDFFNELDNE